MPLPTYTPCNTSTDGVEYEKNLILRYHVQGYSNKEILGFLRSQHSHNISLSTLKRRLKALGLKQRFPKETENKEEIKKAIVNELEGSGSVLGYRKIWHILKCKGVPVKRKTVMEIVKELDPDGVSVRKKRRLKRRVYSVPGPDFLWHIDGYDKLLPFGFAIHGCIDGFSRRIIWLEVAPTNKQPEAVAKFYIDAVHQAGGIPSRMRSDDGSEVSIVEPIQIALRLLHDDEYAGEASFLIGTSPANQKIESYWSQLTKEKPLWWRYFFKELSAYGFIDSSNVLVIEALRYCFMDLIRKDLEDVAIRWNQHQIAPSKNSVLPRGKPDCLYFQPEINNTVSYKKTVPLDEISYFNDPMFATTIKDNDPDFVEFAEMALTLQKLPLKPDSPSCGLKMYFHLLDLIDNCL